MKNEEEERRKGKRGIVDSDSEVSFPSLLFKTL
jgi:hypothetical protein